MATLRGLLSDIEPARSGVQRQFWVWNDSTGIGNGGRCCLWTVPANTVNATFELWGGGGGGHGGCCCQFPNRPAAGGSYAIRTIQTTAGCQYTVCAGGSTTCCCHGCIGGNGYPKFCYRSKYSLLAPVVVQVRLVVLVHILVLKFCVAVWYRRLGITQITGSSKEVAILPNPMGVQPWTCIVWYFKTRKRLVCR